MNNKYKSKSKVQQILVMSVNADTIKSTGRITSSHITGSSFFIFMQRNGTVYKFYG